MSLVLDGDPDRLIARAAFTGQPAISLWDQRFTLPAQVTASLRAGEILTISPIAVTHVGGGAVDASARLALDGTAARASLHVRDFPAGDLPGLERVKLPSFLRTAGAPGATLRGALRGRLDGALVLQGTLAHPAIDGELTSSKTRLAGRVIGDGRLRIHMLADRLAFDGSLGPSIAFDGSLSRGAGRAKSSGTATVRLRNLRLRPWMPAPWASLNVSASGEVTASVAEAGSPVVRGAVRLDSSGGTLQVDGRVSAGADLKSEEGATKDATLDLAMTGQLDAAALADPLRRVGRPSGRVDVAAKISGSVADPTVEGAVRVDAKIRPVRSSLPELRVTGTVEARGETVSTRELHIDVAQLGTFTIGRADHPASLQVGPLWRPSLWQIDLPLSAHHLTFKQPTSAISIDGLDLDLRLLGQIGGDLFLGGEVDLAHAAYNLSGPEMKPEPKPKPASRPSRRPWYESLPPRLTLDLTLRAPRHAMTVEIPVIPDVTVDLECHLFATSRGATLSGHLHGDAAFSRAAIAVYDWLKPEDIRACQLLSL